MRVATTLALSVIALASAAQEAKTPAKVAISFTTPVYAGMPIWMSVPATVPQYVNYPSSWNPTDFGCVQLAVRQGTKNIPPKTLPSNSAGGIVCGWLGVPGASEGRLPLHLQYPNLEPGTYEVRYERYYPDFQTHARRVLDESAWTSLEVRRATHDQTENWISGMLAHVPDSAGQLLGDYLPALLASRSERALNAVLEQTYNKNGNVAHYAANSLLLFNREAVRRALLKTVEVRGPTQALAETLTVLGATAMEKDSVEIANQLAVAAAQFMDSADPQRLAGATHFAWMIGFFNIDDATRAKLAQGWEKAVQRAFEQRNDSAAHDVLMWLGSKQPPHAHEQVWRFVDAQLAYEQALICITWFHNPADLPKLTAIVVKAEDRDRPGAMQSSIISAMGREYGAASRLFMKQILNEAREGFARTAAAQQLVLINDAAGFQYFRTMLDEHPFYYDEMVQWLKDRFPEIRNADRQRMAEYLERKIRESSE
jgi:hypothetical protein